MTDVILKIDECTTSPTSLIFQPDVSVQRWKEIGHSLLKCHGALQWWIGDWINHGEASFGNKYAEAKRIFGIEAKDGYGYDDGTLRNIACVSANVHLSLRNDKLSWNHHLVVANLPAPDQKKWLKKAFENKWGYRELKAALKEEAADPLAGASHSTGFSWMSWVNSGERWLNSEIQKASLVDWETERLQAIRRDFDKLIPIKQAIDEELQRRLV